jgi:hypothetical protein
MGSKSLEFIVPISFCLDGKVWTTDSNSRYFRLTIRIKKSERITKLTIFNGISMDLAFTTKRRPVPVALAWAALSHATPVLSTEAACELTNPPTLRAPTKGVKAARLYASSLPRLRTRSFHPLQVRI